MDGNGMDMMVDLRVAELLASRLCHDLVGPIGAVSNGIELMEDEGFGMADDALALAANSAGQASDLLQFYRLAYGMAGMRQGSDLEPIRALAKGFLSHSKAELDWPSAAAPADMPEGVGKLLLNVVVLAAESLPRGGTVGVRLAGTGAGIKLEVHAVGADAGLRDDAKAGVDPNIGVEELTPRNVHGYFTCLLARRMGGELSAEETSPGTVRFAVAVSS